jgi:hypothetical protein
MPPETLPPPAWKPVEILKLDVVSDPRYAAQARKLSGAHTVPQVLVVRTCEIDAQSPLSGCVVYVVRRAWPEQLEVTRRI